MHVKRIRSTERRVIIDMSQEESEQIVDALDQRGWARPPLGLKPLVALHELIVTSWARDDEA